MRSCASQQAPSVPFCSRSIGNRTHAPAQARNGLCSSQRSIGGLFVSTSPSSSTPTSSSPSASLPSSFAALAAMPQAASASVSAGLYTPEKGITLADFVLEATAAASPSSAQQLPSREASLLVAALERSTRRVAAALSRAGIDDRLGKASAAAAAAATAAGPSAASSSERDAPKELDLVANDILKEELAGTGVVGLLASEEDEEVVVVGRKKTGGENSSSSSSSSAPLPFVAVFDPLDGSSNIAACIPTGTIFGVYRRREEEGEEGEDEGQGGKSAAAPLERHALRPGRELLLAGYSLYSSATMLVLTLSGGSEAAGTHGFTLDRDIDQFVCTHPRIRVPQRGQFYSLNDARFDDWSPELRKYISTVRSGKGQSGKQYAARYVCSLVADLHRTLLYGGWAGNPRSHLRRVYEAAPLSAVTEAAGGRATDGDASSALDVAPEALHSRAPFFAGSSLDIAELLSYGDVRQSGKKKYDV